MTILRAIDEGGELSILLEKVGEGPLGVEELGQLVQWTRRWLGLKAVLEKGEMSFKALKALLLGLTRDGEKEPENEGKDKPEPKPEKGAWETCRKGLSRLPPCRCLSRRSQARGRMPEMPRYAQGQVEVPQASSALDQTQALGRRAHHRYGLFRAPVVLQQMRESV